MHMNDSLWMLFLETRVISSEGDGSFQGNLFVWGAGIPDLFSMDMGSLGSHRLVILASKICFQHLSLYIPGVVYFPAMTLLYTKSAKVQGCDLTVNQDKSVIFNI